MSNKLMRTVKFYLICYLMAFRCWRKRILIMYHWNAQFQIPFCYVRNVRPLSSGDETRLVFSYWDPEFVPHCCQTPFMWTNGIDRFHNVSLPAKNVDSIPPLVSHFHYLFIHFNTFRISSYYGFCLGECAWLNRG